MHRRALWREDRAEMAGQACTWQGLASDICSQCECCWGEQEEATPSPTFLLHSCSEALLKPAVSALVSFVFVYHTLPVKPGKKERCEEQHDSLKAGKDRTRQSPKLQDMLRAGPQRLTLRKEPQSVPFPCLL